MSRNRITGHGPLNTRYLARMEQTLLGALEQHPRLTVVRVDLRIPDNGSFSDNPLERDAPTFFMNTGPNLIKRFIASLKAQIQAEQYAKTRQGLRVHPCKLEHIWAREHSHNHKDHYHVALLLNKDRYHSLGNYKSPGTLAWMIKRAWANALGVNVEDFYTLVHFPENPVYRLNFNLSHEEFLLQAGPALIRLSYLAKERSKPRGTGQRNFGCSNPKKTRG